MKNWWEEGRTPHLKKVPEEEFQPDVRRIEDLDPLYTIQEVAAYFRVTEGTIYKWKSSGLIEATPQGRNIMFTARQIAACKHKRQHGWHKLRKERQLEKVSG